MANDELTAEQVRELAGRLDVRVLNDDIDVVASIYRTHDRERVLLRNAVGLTDEPMHVFAPVAAPQRTAEDHQ
jgi:hypothetical protein